MPSKLRLRPIFAPLVKGIAKILSKLGITSNMATILMLFCSFVCVSMLFIDNILWFGIFLFITGIMDGVDGAIARITNKSSKFGGFFDSTMDRLSESIIFASIMMTRDRYLLIPKELSLFLIIIAALSSFLFSYMRARTELIQKGYDTNVGLMARSERLFFLFVISILSSFFGFVIFTWGFILFTILIVLSAFYRYNSYRMQIHASEQSNG